MVEYQKDSSQHLSQVEVAKGYIESGAQKKGADKYKVLEKLDSSVVDATKANEKFKISDYAGATSFTDALARHVYQNEKGYAGLSHEQRNVILNVYLALASQGLDLNVCRPSDTWKIDFSNQTFEATLDGKKVKGKLEYVKSKEDREKIIKETKVQLSVLKNRITAEAQNVLAQGDDSIESTTNVRKAIEIGSLSNLLATMGSLDASGFEARKALLRKELEDGATKDQLVDDTITGINYYLDLAGAGSQKIDPQNGHGYKGTREQNKAWIKVIEDVLKPGLPVYLASEPKSEAPGASAPEQGAPSAREPRVTSGEPALEDSPSLPQESVEKAPFEFNFIENGPKPNKGVEARNNLKEFLKKHFKARSEAVTGGLTYGPDVEINWKEEGGKRVLEIKWKEGDNDKKVKVAVDAGGIFKGWESSWKEILEAMKHALKAPKLSTSEEKPWGEAPVGPFLRPAVGMAPAPEPETLTSTPNPWGEMPARSNEPSPISGMAEPPHRDELPIHKDSSTPDGVISIGPLEGMGGGKGGEVTKPQVAPRAPESKPTPSIVPSGRPTTMDEGHEDAKRYTVEPKPAKDAGLPTEPVYGDPFSTPANPKKPELNGDIIKKPVSTPSALHIKVPQTTKEVWGMDPPTASKVPPLSEEPAPIEAPVSSSEPAAESAKEAEPGRPEAEPARLLLKKGLKANMKALGISPDYKFEDVKMGGFEFGPAKFKDLAGEGFDGERRLAKEWQGHVLSFESKERAANGNPRVRMEIQSRAYVAYWGAPKIRVWVEGEKELRNYDGDKNDVLAELTKFHERVAQEAPQRDADA